MRSAARRRPGWEVEGAGRLTAPAVFLATGKHDLRGVRRQPSQAAEDLVGLKMYFVLDPAQRAELARHVEILLFRGGYAGLQLIEGGVANLCLLIDRARFKAAGGAWPGVRLYLEQACPHLARRLAGAAEVLDRPLSIFRVPYGHLHAPGPADWPGLFRLGDQMGVIPSFLRRRHLDRAAQRLRGGRGASGDRTRMPITRGCGRISRGRSAVRGGSTTPDGHGLG